MTTPNYQNTMEEGPRMALTAASAAAAQDTTINKSSCPSSQSHTTTIINKPAELPSAESPSSLDNGRHRLSLNTAQATVSHQQYTDACKSIPSVPELDSVPISATSDNHAATACSSAAPSEAPSSIFSALDNVSPSSSIDPWEQQLQVQAQAQAQASQPIQTHSQLQAPQTGFPQKDRRRSSASTHVGPASHESVPRQTILKALASSVARANKPAALSLDGMLQSEDPSALAVTSAQLQAERSASISTSASAPAIRSSTSQRLTDALNDLVKTGSGATPLTAFPVLSSPCFYHQRFEDAVDINKVLEEIKNDEQMSHSRLVQTATGVREVSKQLQRRPIKRAVRNVMIVTKARDNGLVVLTRELATWLLSTPRYGSDLGVNVYVDAKLRKSKRFNAPGILESNPRFEHMLKYWTPDLCWSQPEKFDLVLTLGGDGTVLFTSWLFQRVVPPTLSFSLGSLGFLTTFEFEKYKAHLNRVMGDDGMKINLRMRFTCTVWRAGAQGAEAQEGEQFEVLNELVIDRGPSPYVSNLELYGDDELLTVVQADGCIFSTPTGSTAYSLSAGGSLVHPDIPAILLTPICPHTLSFRPMVLSDTMALRVSVPRNSRATAYCAFDGKGRVELRQGDFVTITASQYPFPTVTRTDTEWFDSVSRTLRWNVRAAAQKPFEAGDDECGDDLADDSAVEWDIDTDSACYASEEGSVAASPLKRQMSLLGL